MAEDRKGPNDTQGRSASGVPENVVNAQSDHRTAPIAAFLATGAPAKDGVAPPKWLPSIVAKERVDFLNKWLQIMAICLGALWAAFVFIETISPGLKPKLNVTGDISWTPTTRSDVCEAHFALVVKNPGPASVTLDKARVKVWVQNLSSTVDQNGKPVLRPSGNWATTLEKQQITGDEGLPTEKLWAYESAEVEPLMGDIRGPYPPGTENSSGQIFFFQKVPDNFVFIEVILDGQGYTIYPFGRQDVHNWGYAMDRVCGPPNKEKLGLPADKTKPRKPTSGNKEPTP